MSGGSKVRLFKKWLKFSSIIGGNHGDSGGIGDVRGL